MGAMGGNLLFIARRIGYIPSQGAEDLLSATAVAEMGRILTPS